MSLAAPAPWLVALPDAEQMRAVDRWAIEERGIPGLTLMERAGEGVAAATVRVAPGGTVAIVCGSGNNGGDGYVVARLLREQGRDVRVLTTGDLAKVSGDAKAMLDRLPGAPPHPFAPGALHGVAVVVDAILGTGFSGTPREDVAAAIEAVNAAGVPVVAVDVPSGVDASTGAVAGAAVEAHVTTTFHAPKPGLWIAPGKQHAGEVVVVDIGIPEGAPVAPAIGLIAGRPAFDYPRRGAASTKFESGHVLVSGGSRGLTGAPCLASLAAARAGAGYVTACVPAALEPIFEIKLTEIMTVGLADESGALMPPAVAPLLEQAARAGAVVLGPGLGRAEGTQAFARETARRAPVPLVLDADGLNAHAGRLEHLRARPAPAVLTPHGGELARLLGIASDDVRAERLACVRDAARRAGAIVVLKGDDTLIAEPEGRVAVSRGDAPALATAGTGDVLSGVLGALLARGMAPFEAACAAVHFHVEAGRRAARLHDGPDGVIASDVVDALPFVLAG